MADSDEQEAMAKRAKVMATVLPILAVGVLGTITFLKAGKTEHHTPSMIAYAESEPAQSEYAVSKPTPAPAPNLKPVSANTVKNPAPAPSTQLYPLSEPPQGKTLVWEKNAPIKPAPEKTLTPTKRPHLHHVRQGETLFSISRQFGITAQQLALANGFPAGKPIIAGQVLRIPDRAEIEGHPNVPNSRLIPTSRPLPKPEAKAKDEPRLMPIPPSDWQARFSR